MDDETELAADDNTNAGEGDVIEAVEETSEAAKAEDDQSTVLTEGDDVPSEGEEESTEGTAGAPEAYEDFVMPEGFDVDESALELAKPLFKELGLDQANAQKAVDVFAKIAGQQAEAMAEGHSAQVAAWTAETTKSMSKEDIGVAVAGLKRFDTEGKVAEVLNSTGLGSHPDVVAFFKRVGEATSEDSFDGKPAGMPGDEKPVEDVLYGNSGQ